MKKLIITSLIPLLLATSCITTSGEKGSDGFNIFTNNKSIEGTGPVKSKTFNMNFDGIKVSNSIQAEVIKSDEEKIVISAPEDLLEEVWVEKNGNEIHIHFRPNLNIRNASQVKATIYAKDFNSLIASSSAKITVKDKFTQDKMDVKVSSSGEIIGDLEANQYSLSVSSSGHFTGRIWAIDLAASISSSGEANISGSSTNVTAQVSSSGELNASNLTAKNADLRASSSGDISMKVSKTLKASASSSGDINITKTNNLENQDIKKSSGGSVNLK